MRSSSQNNPLESPRMLPRSLFLALTVALALVGLVGCGGSDSNEGGGSDAEYPSEVRANFVRACTAKPNAPTSVCECTFEKVQARVSFSDFKRADVATRAGSPVDPQVQTELNNAVADCSGGKTDDDSGTPAPESPELNGQDGTGPEPPRAPSGESLDSMGEIREQCLSQARQLPDDGRRQKGITDCNQIGR